MPEGRILRHRHMQENLFTNHADSDVFELHELGRDWLREYQGAFSGEDAAQLIDGLIEQIPWRQDELWIAGKHRPVPRLQCWMGDAGYGYSGLRLQREPWHPLVLSIKQRVESLTEYRFNSVLLNYYRNGQDSVAWHADDEAELGDRPVIASVSLGAERPFELRPKPGQDGSKCKITLTNGSLLLMGDTLQQHWLHQLPKVKDLQLPRINLTFRTILAQSGGGRKESQKKSQNNKS